MAWKVLYRTRDGRPVSQGTRMPKKLPAGTALKEFAAQPAYNQSWNPSTLVFDDDPPKVVRDRLAELKTRANLKPAQERAVEQWMGEEQIERYR